MGAMVTQEMLDKVLGLFKQGEPFVDLIVTLRADDIRVGVEVDYDGEWWNVTGQKRTGQIWNQLVELTIQKNMATTNDTVVWTLSRSAEVSVFLRRFYASDYL